MTSVTQTPTENPSTASSSARRGRVIALALLAGVVLGGTGLWTMHSQNAIDVVVTNTSAARGIALEARYAPTLPATITGASISTDAGEDADASLYDNSTDSDVAPTSVAVRVGRSISIYATITPDCTVAGVSDAVTVSLSTPTGTRTLHADVTGLAQAIDRICGGPVRLDLTQAHRDGNLVSGTYDTAPTAQRVTLSLRGTQFTADPIVLNPGGGQVQWTITTTHGCQVATEPVLAVATFDNGRQTPLHMSPPGRQVCGHR
jgi:hypothetical protein